ncbi:tail fiber domain-containing protein [Flavobacterium buctense]|uniref:Tail fiber domain-containing protein n=1 Tax=Flavobacterium buctense TaxID=1648146 RepID=A0ABU9DXW9_9FLAO|nr:tail fiber domain-containing protein [Flavobacterium buctense]
MIKKIILLLLIVLGSESWAQVGINTTTPKAQLEIKSTNEATPANTDGLLIPKINAFPVTNPTVDQQGMLVYLTTTIGANTPGFYYWNNPTTAWLPVKGTDGGTLDQAYDFGGAGNGRTITADSGAVTIAGTDGLVSTGTSGSGALAPSGAGTRMVWNPRKAAFRAGNVSGTQWDDASIGTNSVAFGNVTTASGPNSMAFGSGSTASNNVSTAFGNGTTASGPNSTAFGFATTASGASSTTFGTLTAATALNSSAFGRNNTSSSYGETVIGIGATTYTPSTNGTTQFRSTNSTDRLFVIGNAIDANNNDIVDTTERSDAMVVLKNGNIGVGISTPQNKLHFHNPTGFETFMQLTNSVTGSAATDGVVLGNTVAGGEAGIVNQENSNFYLFSGLAGEGQLTIGGNGNVGIGTFAIGAPPQAKFHVLGSIRMEDGSQAAGKVLTSDANGTGTWTTPGAVTAGTLDQSYDFGGAGAGRTITADTGAVTIAGTDGLVSTGTNGSGSLAPSGSGTKMFWNPRKSAFRAGFVNGTQWDDASIGNVSFAFGQNTIANNISATAFGLATTASGYSSTAFGIQNTAPSCGETVIGIGATEYTPSSGGNFLNRTTNATDRLFVVGNAIDANNNSTVDVAERSDALVVLKNGNIGLGISAPGERLQVAGKSLFTNGFSSDNAALIYRNDTDYMFLGPQSGSSVDGGAMALYGSTNVSGGNAGGIDLNVPNAQVRMSHTNGSYAFRANSTSGYAATFELNDTGLEIGHNSAGRALIFSPNSAERMRITPTGNVGIGTTTPATTLEVVNTNAVTSPTVEGTINVMTNGPQAIDAGGSITLGGTFTDAGTTFRTFGSIEARKANATTNSSSGYLILKTNNAGILSERMRITNAGDVGIGIVAPGGQLELSLNEGRKPTSNTWTIPSDARLKNVDGIYQKGLTEILQLKPIRYHYKNTDKKSFESEVLEKEAYGFLAQEVQQIFPEAVGTDADGYLNFDLHPILVAYTNAFKELDLKNQSVENKNRELELKLKSQEQIINNLIERLEKLEAKN